MIRLHVACGPSLKEGFTGLDTHEEATIKHDPAVFPWPLDDNSVEEAFTADHVHRTTPVGGTDDGLVALMNEFHRVLAPRGSLRIVHPFAKTDRALQDPTTTRLISDATWWYFDGEWRAREGLHRPSITADFQVVSIEAPLQREWDLRADVAQAFARRHYWNVAGDLEVVLRARKRPQPGP